MNNNHVVMSVSFMGVGTVCCHLGLYVYIRVGEIREVCVCMAYTCLYIV